ncbi:MAG: sulfotransferase [Ferrovibrio sp.]
MRSIIHIGVGKTGTTSLQENLLARHPSILNIGRPWRDEDSRKAAQQLIRLDDWDYDAVWMAQYFKRLAAEAAEKSATLVLSDEILSSSEVLSLTARRLHSLLPDAEIVCTLRHQVALVESFYTAHATMLKGVPGRWNGRSVSFAEWLDHALAIFPAGYLGLLRFDRLLGIFAQAFGQDRIHVFLYEELLADPTTYWGRWARLLGIETGEAVNLMAAPRKNERSSAREAAYQAVRSHILPNASLTKLMPFGNAARATVRQLLKGGKPHTIRLREADQAAINLLFAGSNRHVAEQFNLDLGRFNYPLK